MSEEKRSVKLQVWITPEESIKLKETAKGLGISVSDLTRMVLKQALANGY
ncbi:plasmid mobilization protein [Scytonema sp. PCC 10023]